MNRKSLSAKLKPIVDSKAFNYTVLSVIIFSAILVGFSLNMPLDSPWYPTVNLLEGAILTIFCIEIITRIFAEEKPFNFFKDSWNLFDFAIVLACFIPLKDKAIYVLRLVRVIRTFRLFRAFPNIRPVVKGLIESISSVVFVALLLFVIIYIYTVIGVSLFNTADPEHFGSIWKGGFTMFQILTLENWNTIMVPANAAYPVGGPLYFISFIIIATMVIMNLFLGIIVGNMSKAMDKLNSPEQMKNYLDEDAMRERQLSTKLRKIEKQLSLLIKKKK
ncbi:MAG: ion transporter [Candidatus Diapherotrites archaeon]|nr:ion transporter [Candidatus Diapherotrites archaeon]